MASESRQRLDVVLADVDTHISEAKKFSGGKRGAPAAVGGAKRPGRPFTRAATVLLAGAIEGYVEAVVLETAEKLGLSTQQIKDLKAQIGRSHGANVYHVHQLTAQIGLPFIADSISWSGVRTGSVRTFLGELATRRNKIAHGSAPNGTMLREVERWRRYASGFADGLDRRCSEAVKNLTGVAPW